MPRESIEVSDGAFLYVAGKQKLADRKEPYKIVVHDKTGNAIDEKRIRVGLPRNAREAGITLEPAAEACATP